MKNIILSFLFFIPGLLLAQTPSPDQNSDMSKLSFMVGEWEGEGWSMTRNGRETSRIHEKVECKLDCNILAVSGQGIKINPETMQSSIVHDAFGVITYDPGADRHMIRAYKQDNVVETEILFLEEKLFQWQIPAPGGNVRFTVDFRDEDTWKETGEFSRDGVNWMKSMEMELRKKG